MCLGLWRLPDGEGNLGQVRRLIRKMGKGWVQAREGGGKPAGKRLRNRKTQAGSTVAKRATGGFVVVIMGVVRRKWSTGNGWLVGMAIGIRAGEAC